MIRATAVYGMRGFAVIFVSVQMAGRGNGLCHHHDMSVVPYFPDATDRFDEGDLWGVC